MRLLLLAGSPAAAARILPFCPDGAEIVVRSDPYAEPLAGAPPDVAVGCDAAGRTMLAQVSEATARVGLIASYGLEPGSAGDVASVDLWAVGHPAVADVLRADDVAADAIEVTGIPIPPGFAAAPDRAAARVAAGLPADDAVLLVRTDAAPDEIGALLVQLALLDGRPLLLFDVGDDEAATARLRAEVPHRGLRAKMFAAGPDAGSFAARADLAVVPPDPFAIARAAACESASLVLGQPRRGTLDAAIDCGAARVCTSLSRLAADIDVLRTSGLASTRRAAASIAIGDAAARFRALVARAASERAALSARRRRRGLPVGLEDLSGPEPAPAPARPPAPDIDDELEALRKRIGKS